MKTTLRRLLFLSAVGLGALGDTAAQTSASATVSTPRDAAGNTPLHLAALNHDVAAVRTLLAAGAEVDAKNAAEATPLLYGAGEAEIVRLLLARGANPNAASKSKNTPLIAAASHPNSFAAVSLLLEAGADVHAVKRADIEPALDRAVQAGDRRTVDLLLAKGAAKNPKAVSAALSTAAWQGNLAVVKLLLERGGDPNYEDGFTGHALNVALYGGHPDVALALIGSGADLKRRSTRGHGTPPMVWAAYNDTGDPTVARALLARGVDINEANDAGATALTFAERNGTDTPLVRALREAGAKSPEPAHLRKLPERAVPATPEARAALVRERLQPTLDLLARTSGAFLDNAFVQRSKCTSCHQQDLPAVAFELARARGLRVDDAAEGRQHDVLTARWNAAAENARQMTDPVPDAVVSLGYGLFGLRAAHYAADEMTDALVRYLIRAQHPNGSWASFDRRPPMEDGVLVGTAWATLSLRDYPPAALTREAAAAEAKAARWLAAQTPATHNDTVFQLLGLHWAGVPPAERAKAVERLLALQRPDGGWAQLPGRASDAWATGVSLYALHEAAGMKPTDAVYQRGVAYLLRTQYEDGSWWVQSRTWPFQPHFDGKFPHGKDQWISAGGTAWAAMALLFTLDPVASAAPAPTAQQMMAAWAASPTAKRLKNAAAANTVPNAGAAPAPATATPANASVDFARDIQPLFERSCAGCHNPEKQRGKFALSSREALLKGGASGEPAIAPGYADDSTLIHYVSGKIEDLEMPPLDRREKYPALTAAEIDLLRAWIDSGAAWPAAKPAEATPKPASIED